MSVIYIYTHTHARIKIKLTSGLHRNGNVWANMLVTYVDYVADCSVDKKQEKAEILADQAASVLLFIGRCNDMINKSMDCDPDHQSDINHMSRSFKKLQRFIRTPNFTANILDKCTHNHSDELSAIIKSRLRSYTGH